jgi:hypothetical protein
MGRDELKDQAAESGGQDKVGDMAGVDKVVEDATGTETGGDRPEVDEGQPVADQ